MIASRTGHQLLLCDDDHHLPAKKSNSSRHQHHNTAANSSSIGGSSNGPNGVANGKTGSSTEPQPAAAAGAGDAKSLGEVVQNGQNQQQQQEGQQQQQDEQEQQQQDRQQLQEQQQQRHEGDQQQQQEKQTARPIPVPLLVLMSCPATPFYKGLALFQQRMVCANVHHDPTVPYCTASITLTNPFEDKKHLPIDPKYPSVVRVAAEGEEVPLVKYKGRSRLYIFLLLSPVLVPLIPIFWVKIIVQGMIHHRRSRRSERDTSWWYGQGSKGGAGKVPPAAVAAGDAAAAGAEGQVLEASGGTGVAAVPASTGKNSSSSSSSSYGHQQQGGWRGFFSRVFGRQTVSAERWGPSPAAVAGAGVTETSGAAAAAGVAAYATSAQEAEPRQQQQQQWQEDGSGSEDDNTHNPVPTSHQGEQLEAMMSSGLPDAVQEGLDMVSEALQAVHHDEAVHEGIYTLPGPVKQQQEWMVGQLRALPGGWHQVDVCTGHYHAHAAIVVRDGRFESQRRDLFQYIADHFVL